MFGTEPMRPMTTAVRMVVVPVMPVVPVIVFGGVVPSTFATA